MRAFTIRADGTPRYLTVHPIPYNWKRASGDAWVASDVQQENAGYWANALVPYTKNWGIADGTGFTKIRNAADATDFADPNPPAKAESISVTMNGLLHTLSSSQVTNPAIVPLFWGGNGKAAYEGRSIANPVLNCGVDAANNTAGCKFDPSAGPGYTWTWGTGASVYMFANGDNVCRTDSSAKFARHGRITGPSTGVEPNRDYYGSPFAHINTNGSPLTMWGCTIAGATKSYACYFRPDRDQ